MTSALPRERTIPDKREVEPFCMSSRILWGLEQLPVARLFGVIHPPNIAMQCCSQRVALGHS
jgi:hypothetical protein